MYKFDWVNTLKILVAMIHITDYFNVICFTLQ